MRALEFDICFYSTQALQDGFNPFVPNEGVGIQLESWKREYEGGFQSFCAE